MNTLPDISVNELSWTEVLAASGLSGSVELQPKAGSVRVCFGDTAPAANDNRGLVLRHLERFTVSGESKIWVKAKTVNKHSCVHIRTIGE